MKRLMFVLSMLVVLSMVIGVPRRFRPRLRQRWGVLLDPAGEGASGTPV